LSAVRILALASLLFLSACSGGGGGGSNSNVFSLNGGAVTGSVTNSSLATFKQTYTFNAAADTAYTVSTVTNAGNISISIYNGNPATSGSILLGNTFSSLTTSPYDAYSFVATFTGPVYIVVQNFGLTDSTYTLQAFSGELTLGATKTASTYNDVINYSFEAQANTAYQVRLTPQTGNVNIGSVNAKQTASVGSSLLTGTSMDGNVSGTGKPALLRQSKP
jgi:hypothetical protein